MDILNSIKSKLESSYSINELPGTKAVLTHIEVAERYFDRAKKYRDEHLFTDVIYRCNHAFEGILKEAFTHFEGKDSSKKTPNDIEKYLVTNAILKERVLDLFTNYRQNWRNPSTHDYKLFFTEQEAFLAIVTVSAFVSILLDQVVERISYESEKNEFATRSEEIKKSINKYDSLNFADKVAALTNKFAIEVISGNSKPSERSESQLVGTLSGFINSVEPEYKITSEPSFNYRDSILRPDLLIESHEGKVILEIKRASGRRERVGDPIDLAALEQVKTYQKVTGIKEAILFFYPDETDTLIMFSPISHKRDEEEFTIYQISPGEINEESV